MSNMMITRRSLIKSAAIIPLTGIAGRVASASSRDQTLRVVMINDLRSIDPVATSTGITVQHAFMVYDTLFAPDEAQIIRPQMVETWSRSNDGLTYTFTLRPGLRFHDGSPVTAVDVTSSIRRWAKRSLPGQIIPGLQEGLSEVDAQSFKLVLAKPFPFTIDAFGSLTAPLFIMRAADAQKPPTEAVSTAIGSGPFRFVHEEWVPGSKAVYVRNRDYIPRSEDASGFAGGIRPKVDRVEFIHIPDFATRVSALKAGEVHLVESIEGERLLEAQADKNIAILRHPARGWYNLAVLNHTQPPFNHPSARRALLHLIDQEEVLSGAVGDQSLFETCHSFFACNTPFSTEAGTESLRKVNVPLAEKLLQEAGYKGQPIVVMMATDQPDLANATQVLVSQLRRAKSLNVKPMSMDWGALVTRRNSKAPPENGGWSIFLTTGGIVNTSIPTLHFYGRANGPNAWFGWPDDPEAERMRLAWAELGSDEERQKGAQDLQRRWVEHTVPFVPLGITKSASAYRKDMIKGVLATPIRTPMWNIELI